MLRANPRGGRPMAAIGSLDWDETYPNLQYKLGYCGCGKKILATPLELEELVGRFKGFKTRHYDERIPFRKRIALRLGGKWVIDKDKV